jgi:hypothetical protein
MMDSMRSLLEKLSQLEEATTPVSVKQGLNSQQQSVDQLPALFRPKSIQALKAKTDPTHPMKGKFVGDGVEPKKRSLDETMRDIEEDMLSRVKRDLTQYLDQLEKKNQLDRDLIDKAKDAVERRQAEEEDVQEDPTTQDLTVAAPPSPQIDPTLPESAPIKTITFEDGSEFEILGDQRRGFEVRHSGKTLPTRFNNIDHAQMALDLFQHRRNKLNTNADYIDEK